MNDISPLSRVSPEARLGEGVTIGDFTVVHGNVEIGAHSTIGSHCVIGVPTRLAEGRPLVIGEHSLIRSHCVIYEGSTFGPKFETGHHATLREKITAGINFRVGTQCDLQGDQTYGHYCRLHSDVHFGKHTHVGHFVWVFPRTMTTNDPFPPSHTLIPTHIEDLAVICTNAMMLPGVRIGLGSFVAAGSLVRHSVPDVTCVAGNPAEKFALLHQFVNMERGLRAPWPLHFRDAYPPEAQPLLDEVMTRVKAAISDARQRPRDDR